ncbi:MAG: hydroxymethylglutaryl-CoA synthase family protein [Acidobacteria bacterium]|nr:hydroxymethylglutaryl-CoA synthase family protein [Acidobacteriota bacterium]
MTGEPVAGVERWGGYVPAWRLARAVLGRAWDTPSVPGERSVCAGDEDSLTMGIEAALACTGGDAGEIDAIFFATTTAPYAEKQGAATIAAVLDRSGVLTADVTGTLRAGTTALRAALGAVRAGTARKALVVAADARPAEPATTMEQLFGDGAAALIVGSRPVAEVTGEASVAEDFTGPWRRTGDPYVRSFEPKLETEYGYLRPVERAVREALAAAGITPDAVSRFAAYAPDSRAWSQAAKRAGLAGGRDPLLAQVGNLGAAHAPLALCAALDEAAPGEHIVLAGQGEGADALVLRVSSGVEAARPAASVAGLIASKRMLPSYESYLRFRRLLPSDASDPRSSTVTYWRDRAQALPLYGVRCTACGVVQFPANRSCIECFAFDRMEPAKLARRGAVFTFTLDHLAGGEYLETPVPRAVVDLDGGGRIFLEVTDADPRAVRIGMPVELTFRKIHEGAGFKNYYWKARAARVAPQGSAPA